MRRIWATDESEFHSDHVDFDPLWSWPKSAQHPSSPVLFGGNGPGRLRERAAEAGRGHVPVTMFGAPDDLGLLEHLAAAGLDRCLIPVRSGDSDELSTRLDALDGIVDALASR